MCHLKLWLWLPRAGVGKLACRPKAASFCLGNKLYWNTVICSFIYLLPTASRPLQRQSWAIATETAWLAQLKIFIIWPFTENNLPTSDLESTGRRITAGKMASGCTKQHGHKPPFSSLQFCRVYALRRRWRELYLGVSKWDKMKIRFVFQ